MRIVQSAVVLTSQRSASVSDTTTSSIQAWVGERPGSGPVTRVSHGTAATPAALASLTSQARAMAARESAAALQSQRARLPVRQFAAASPSGASSGAGPDLTDPTITDPNLTALLALIERLTGHKIHLVKPGDVAANAGTTAQQAGQAASAAVAASQGNAAAGNAATGTQQQAAGWGVEVKAEQVHQEQETTAFQASGQVTTADGQTVVFDYGLAMHRELTQTSSTDIQAGDAVRKIDPIALSLGGGPAALSDTRTGFDLNSDGTAENVAMPAAGTYFVALDRNGNGAIDNGTELFGPQSGNGFTELKALDDDGNGWIDEADAAYSRLSLWSGPATATMSLAEAGVGALYVGQSAATQFDLRDSSNNTLGQVISSSVYLGENGKPGVLQQVDLAA